MLSNNSDLNDKFDNLKLAIKLNHIDEVKKLINNYEKKFYLAQVNCLMELALIHNRVELAQFLLENGFDLKKFLNLRRLYYLYNSDIVRFVIHNI